jgi:CRISPR/Cas system CMR-associated protein Cmr3 (group 5 of RAMP superfamily)
MAMAEVVVTAIKNRTRDTITIPHQQRGPIEIEPGGSLAGPFVFNYDTEKHGTIPSPNEVWFIDSPHEFEWGTVAISNPDV